MEKKNTAIKYTSLVVLILQIVVHIIVVRYSRTSSEQMYFATVTVVVVEILKVLTCLIITLFVEKSISGWLSVLHQHIIVEYKTTLKVAVPASVFALQNNMQFVALSNLEAATYQVTYQLKILTTAFFSVIILKRELSRVKWISLVVLFVGIATVHLDHTKVNDQLLSHNSFVGLLAVTTCALCSGFANVYFEKILKETTSVSIWIRNIQMGMFGALFGSIGAFFKDGPSIQEKGIFFGYNNIVLFVVFWNVFGGLLVAVVVKYADNVLKVFATSFSIVLACAISILLLNFKLTIEFIVGTTLVLVATYMFSIPLSTESK